MIEYTRFLLSCIVLEVHIWPLDVPWLAFQSVFAFYTLSGYLMTRVLVERYGFGPRNFVRYMANRVLRLWPAYLVFLGIAAVSVMTLGAAVMAFGQITMPHNLSGAVVNVTVLGLVGFDFAHFVRMSLVAPTAWSLSVEMFSYVLLGAYFARTPRRLAALALIGAASLAWSTGSCALDLGPPGFYGRYCFQSGYGVLQSGFIPFAAGGLLYFHLDRVAAIVARWWRWLVLAIIVASLVIFLTPVVQFTVSPYLGIVIIGTILPFAVRRRGRATRLQDFFGRASYHLFIGQWTVAALLAYTTKLPHDSFPLFLATLAASLALSLLLVPMERRIERLRRRVAPIGPAQTDVFAAAPAVTV